VDVIEQLAAVYVGEDLLAGDDNLSLTQTTDRKWIEEVM
jgi:hypothetical protein